MKEVNGYDRENIRGFISNTKKVDYYAKKLASKQDDIVRTIPTLQGKYSQEEIGRYSKKFVQIEESELEKSEKLLEYYRQKVEIIVRETGLELQTLLEDQERHELLVENQWKIERMNNDELFSSIREYRSENAVNPQFLKTCEFELAKRIIEGKITSAPDGFEDIFEEFQLAVELELARQNQSSIELEDAKEEK